MYKSDRLLPVELISHQESQTVAEFYAFLSMPSHLLFDPSQGRSSGAPVLVGDPIHLVNLMDSGEFLIRDMRASNCKL
jgi:hypothetical protein